MVKFLLLIQCTECLCVILECDVVVYRELLEIQQLPCKHCTM